MDTILDLKYDIVHNKIIYEAPSPLQQLATVKIAVNIWYEKASDLQNGSQLQRMMQEKVLLLMLPKKLAENIGLMAELVGEQLIGLSKILDKRINFSSSWFLLRKRIQWTTQGTIDKKRTLESFTDCDDLSLETRFKIASEFYLEDRIHALSFQLPHGFMHNCVESFLSIFVMEGLSTARNTLRCKRTVSGYKRLFRNILLKRNTINEIECYYYWSHLTDQAKYDIVLEYKYRHPNISLFSFTELDRELKIQLFNDQHLFFCLLNVLLGLRWFSILAICLKELSNDLNPIFLFAIFEKCVEKLGVTYAYKKKYAEVCAMLIQSVYYEKPISARLANLAEIVCNLLKYDEMKLIEDILESLSIEDRRETLLQTNWNDLKLLFITFLKHGAINFIVTSLFPIIEDRENFLTNKKFANIVSSLIQNKQFCYLDEIFASLFSNFGNIESYKKQFDENFGFRICQKFLADNRWESIDDYFQWCLSTEDEIISFYDIAISIAIRSRKMKRGKVLMNRKTISLQNRK